MSTGDRASTTSAQSAEIREKARRYFLPGAGHYYDEPLVAVRGEGSRLWDADGREYLDFFGGILVTSVGHAHPEVAEAVAAQARTLVHTSALYATQPAADLAETLARLAPGGLCRTFFTNSGSEAVDTAVLLAKAATGRQEVVALRHGYSGRSALGQALTGQAGWRGVPAQVPGVAFGHAPYCYRCDFGLTYPSCDLRCAKDLESVIQTSGSGQPAAFVAEPVQGTGGFVTPPREYFQVAVGIVRRYGGLFVDDEVQSGIGRTGRWFAIEHYGVEPDLMAMAKGIAGGMPLGATMATEAVASAVKGAGFSTFGGNPVCAAASLATIRVLEREDGPGRAERLGRRLREGLEALKARHPVIGDVRGLGLMQGLELIDPASGAAKAPAAALLARVMDEARRRGLLVGRAGLYRNVLRIGPSLLVSESEIDEALRLLDEAFTAATAAGGPM
ncbi:MAG TPA: aspartate aminotransferase family protein [Thermodesulfobacteriota bacterium]